MCTYFRQTYVGDAAVVESVVSCLNVLSEYFCSTHTPEQTFKSCPVRAMGAVVFLLE